MQAKKHKELALLATETAAAPPVVHEGRSRRAAATAAQTKIAVAAAFETSRPGSMSPPVGGDIEAQTAVLRQYEAAQRQTVRAVEAEKPKPAAIPPSPATKSKRKAPERSNSPTAQGTSKRNRAAANGPLAGVLEAAKGPSGTLAQSSPAALPGSADGLGDVEATERSSKRVHRPSVRLQEIHQPPKPPEKKHHTAARASSSRPTSGAGIGSSVALQRTMFLPNGHKPETPEEAGSDIPALIAMAAACEDIEAVIAQIDVRLPAYKGNNIHARLLRMAFTALRLGGFTLRKPAVSVMAKKLWLLAGKLGEAAAQEAAATVGIDHLPENLKAFGATDATPSSDFLVDEAVEKYFGPFIVPPARTGGGGGGGAISSGPSFSGGSAGGGGAAYVPYVPKSSYRASASTSNFVPPVVDLSKYDERLVKFAQLGRAILRMRRGDQAKLQQVLKTHLLLGQKVRYQHRSGRIMNTGAVTDRGLIRCDCSLCNSEKDVTPTDFEIHAGSGDRRPADSIYFVDIPHSFRDLLTVMMSDAVADADVHMDHCLTCKLGGELVCCDGCTAAYHLECIGLPEVPTGHWFCGACVAEQHLRATMATSRGKSRGRGRGSSSAGRGRGRGRGGGGGAGGRVHMLAPSAQRRNSRPTRNLNRNKRLFEGVEGGLKHGDHLHYITRGATVLSGTAVIDLAGQSGILCECCNKIVSCSQFESHAGHSQRRQPYECIFADDGRNLKTIALALPAPEGLDDDGAEEGAGDGDGDGEPGQGTGGCVLCHDPEFQRGEFGPRTMMLCDQCEREFHVGCMTAHGIATLDGLPEGDWFCSEACGKIHGLLRMHVAAGQIPVVFDEAGMPYSKLPGLPLPPGVGNAVITNGPAAGVVDTGSGGAELSTEAEVEAPSEESSEEEEEGESDAEEGKVEPQPQPHLRVRGLPTQEEIAAAAAAAIARLQAGLATGEVPIEDEEVEEAAVEIEPAAAIAPEGPIAEPAVDAVAASSGVPNGPASDLELPQGEGADPEEALIDAGDLLPAAAPAAGGILPSDPLSGALPRPVQGSADAPTAAPANAPVTTAPSLPVPMSAAALHAAGYTWQVLNGKDGKVATTYSVRAAMEILQESFDPIIDLSTNTDLLPLMLNAEQYRDWDYRGVYTLLLRYKNKPVVAATSRVFGPQYAELPLIATRSIARRQGHARVLVNLFIGLLKEAGVHTLVLPAAHETVETWKNGFQFIDMPEEEVSMAKQQLRILVFPGTEVLWKVVQGTEEATGHHVLRALPSHEAVVAVRSTVQDLVTAVAVAAGEEEGPAPVFGADAAAPAPAADAAVQQAAADTNLDVPGVEGNSNQEPGVVPGADGPPLASSLLVDGMAVETYLQPHEPIETAQTASIDWTAIEAKLLGGSGTAAPQEQGAVAGCSLIGPSAALAPPPPVQQLVKRENQGDQSMDIAYGEINDSRGTSALGVEGILAPEAAQEGWEGAVEAMTVIHQIDDDLMLDA